MGQSTVFVQVLAAIDTGYLENLAQHTRAAIAESRQSLFVQEITHDNETVTTEYPCGALDFRWLADLQSVKTVVLAQVLRAGRRPRGHHTPDGLEIADRHALACALERSNVGRPRRRSRWPRSGRTIPPKSPRVPSVYPVQPLPPPSILLTADSELLNSQSHPAGMVGPRSVEALREQAFVAAISIHHP